MSAATSRNKQKLLFQGSLERMENVLVTTESHTHLFFELNTPSTSSQGFLNQEVLLSSCRKRFCNF